MQSISNLGAFLLAATLVIVIPGPATLYVTSQALASGRRAAMAVLGIVTGDIVLIAAAAMGFAALLAAWPMLLQLSKWLGAAYLAYLSIGVLRAPDHAVHPMAPVAGGGAYRQALLITLSNPKPIVFFAAFFPTFIAPTAQVPWHSFVALGFAFEGVNLLYFAGLIVLVGQLRRRATRGTAHSAMVRKASAGGLLLCSVLILLT